MNSDAEAIAGGMLVVGDDDYMLPIAAQMPVRVGKHDLMRNDLKYTQHRRSGAASSIKFN